MDSIALVVAVVAVAIVVIGVPVLVDRVSRRAAPAAEDSVPLHREVCGRHEAVVSEDLIADPSLADPCGDCGPGRVS